MAIETKVQTKLTLQNTAYAVLCLGLALWGWYDYSIKIPAQQAAFEEYAAAEKTKSELENLAKATALSDAEKEQFRAASDVLLRYKDEKPAEPAAYDRPVQLWLYIVGCGVMGVPYFVWVQFSLSRRRYRLDDDGTLHAPEGTFAPEKIAGLDLTKWMAKSIATVEVEGGTKITLDDYKYKHVEDIVAALAARFYPGEWTSDARPIGDPKSRDTKKAQEEAEKRAADGGDTAETNGDGDGNGD
ncbi:MAG: hypothetical protein LW806_01255 [Planctomycetaceae bacterium]|nr:hypothetical protein [Planctomycetaceae bacterium]